MKQKKVSIILIFILIFSSLIISLSSSVNAETITTLETWESYSIGNSSGNGKYFNWERVSGDDFNIVSTWDNPDKSLYLDNQDSNLDGGWLNSTTDLGYIGSFKIYFKANAGGQDTSEIRLIFYNNSIEVLSLTLGKLDGVGHYGWEMTDVLDTKYEIYNKGPSSDFEGYIKITHDNTNVMNYSVYNTTDVLKGYCLQSSRNLSDWFSFDSINIYGYFASAAGPDLWIDEIIISDTSDSGDGCLNLNSVTIDSVPDILLPDVFCYKVTATGDIGTMVNFMIKDSVGSVLILDGFTLESTTQTENICVTFSPFWDTGNYTITVSDWLFIPCGDDFTYDFNFNVFDTITPDYDTRYLNDTVGLYAEFKDLDDNNPIYNDICSIVYHLPNNNSCMNNADCGFNYGIVLMKDNIYKDHFEIYGDGFSHIDVDSFGLYDEYGRYQLIVYNATGNRNDITSWRNQDNVLYESNFVNIIFGDSYDDELSTGIEDEIFGVPGSLLFTMVGLIIVFMGFIFPSIIEHNMNAKGHRVNIPREVNVFSGLIAIIGCVMMGFFTLWIIFMFALAMLVFIIMKAKKYI